MGDGGAGPESTACKASLVMVAVPMELVFTKVLILIMLSWEGERSHEEHMFELNGA